MKLDELIEGLKRLRLNAMARDFAVISTESEKLNRSYEQHLAALVEYELTDKNFLRREKLIKEAKIPLVKLVCDFDYSKRKGISPAEVSRLCTGDFLKNGTNIVFYGSFGVGKSHLAMAIARELCQRDYRCLFTSTAALINDLCVAQSNLTLSALFRKFERYDLIILDELRNSGLDDAGDGLLLVNPAERGDGVGQP